MLIADLDAQNLEKTILESLPFSLGFYVRYVDDIALSMQEENIVNLLNMFNTISRLNFIMKRSGNCLNFLDVTLVKKDDYLIYDWYYKLSFSARYLNFRVTQDAIKWGQL